MSTRKKKVIRSLRSRAEALGVDVSGLTDEELEARIRENSRRLAGQAVAGQTDEELEARIRENSRRLAGQAAAGVRSAVKGSVSRLAKLRASLSNPDKKG